MKILVINGPNINFLGIREKSIYGNETYQDLLKMLDEWALEYGVEVEAFQSNWEGAIVDRIQAAYKRKDGIIINPAAYTHYSIAILDALLAVGIPTVEVHISDINQREDFRKKSYISDYALATISGKGLDGYRLALEKLIELGEKDEDTVNR